MPLLVPSQRTLAWQSAHDGRITASIAAGALGMDGHCSRQKAWRTVLGLQKQHANRFTDWGHQTEGKAREVYEIETGNLVVETGFWVHPRLDWLGASPDGLVGPDGLLEVKCPGSLPRRIPLAHRIQCLIQIAVTERAWCDYVVYADGETFVRRVYRCPGIDGLVRRLAAFREAYVLTNTEPPRKTPRRKK